MQRRSNDAAKAALQQAEHALHEARLANTPHLTCAQGLKPPATPAPSAASPSASCRRRSAPAIKQAELLRRAPRRPNRRPASRPEACRREALAACDMRRLARARDDATKAERELKDSRGALAAQLPKGVTAELPATITRERLNPARRARQEHDELSRAVARARTSL